MNVIRWLIPTKGTDTLQLMDVGEQMAVCLMRSEKAKAQVCGVIDPEESRETD